ncbi:MAG: RNA 3'-terminal-phosphate cyclase [Betaproteobacteria bacterium RIFCSPLOWO2_02_FULL_65_24]|nr:MAG: RNA 3'-terminal-phosphate cyclase [Betaproteobacteria bacterium RIFCSPLOWO2_02_FULL_65_24]
MLEINGSYGEGGGQLVRTAVALAALTRTPIRIRSVRAKRGKPGLAPQHLTAVHAVAAICDARVQGLELRSEEVVFEPGRVRGGAFTFDVGTAGSITLVLQALLPVMVASPASFHVRLAGGTDVRGAPPLDYLRMVLLGLLQRMGAQPQVVTLRRGYYPRGGGLVDIKTSPARLRPLRLDSPGRLIRVEGFAHVSRLPARIAERMGAAALDHLGMRGVPARCSPAALPVEEAAGPGGAVVMWMECEHTLLGAGRVAQRGVSAEALGAAVGDELAADWGANASLDVHASDQILCYLALAAGPSCFIVRELTSHARTAMWLIEQFLPVRFAVVAEHNAIRVTVASAALA